MTDSAAPPAALLANAAIAGYPFHHKLSSQHVPNAAGPPSTYIYWHCHHFFTPLCGIFQNRSSAFLPAQFSLYCERPLASVNSHLESKNSSVAFPVLESVVRNGCIPDRRHAITFPCIYGY
ncbi:hypothetical protein SLA2020_310990 [Shorea laevis]